MPFNVATLALLLASGGSPEIDSPDLDLVLAQQLARIELGRDMDENTGKGILAALKSGLDASEIRVALRGSYEQLVTHPDVAGDNSEAFRRLGAYAALEGLSASSFDVAECIAAYRLVLGREPDSPGFASFLASRHTDSLPSAVRGVLGSPEAAAFFAPDPPPSVAATLPGVLLAAANIVHAAASDAILGAVARIGPQVRDLGKRLDELEEKLDHIADLVLLRLDAAAMRP